MQMLSIIYTTDRHCSCLVHQIPECTENVKQMPKISNSPTHAASLSHSSCFPLQLSAYTTVSEPHLQKNWHGLIYQSATIKKGT